jgi:hypothetical protein
MHDKITEFAFSLTYDSPGLATDVVGRMPSLNSLICIHTTDYHLPEYDQVLQLLLSSLHNLQEVTLPKHNLDGGFLKTLSLLPELEVVKFDNLGGTPCDVTPTIGNTPEEGTFPKLRDLCLDSTLEDMRLYLTGGVLLPQLKSLSVESVRIESPEAVQEFLNDVTRCYPTLEVLSMDVIVYIEEQADCQPLSLEHFHPILSLTQLVRLELRHNLPLQISEDDLTEFGVALPAIEFLVLNPEPLLLTKPNFTLHSLRIIAQIFPNLSHLGIYLDAEDVEIHPLHSPVKTQVFPYLRTLNVGVSPIGLDHVPVALFLSHLLSDHERVAIQSGVSWATDLFDGSSEYEFTVRQRCHRWEDAAKTLPLLLQLRKEEKAHRQDIEKEVEDLRMRNEVLIGRMRIKESAKSARAIDDKGCTIC